MKKLFLSTIALYVMLMHAYSQTTTTDSAAYEIKPLRLDEITLVSSYYTQNGNHSAVTGGIGTEKVTDLSNGLELSFVGWDAGRVKHTITAGLGFDHHTSASSAYVSKTGASKTGGTRIYPSLNWMMENQQKGTSFGAGLYYSSEYNYQSIGADINFSKKTKNNGEFSAKVNAYFDQVTLIYPSELIPKSTSTSVQFTSPSYNYNAQTGSLHKGEINIPTAGRNTFSGTLSFAQVINKRLQGSITMDIVGQSGYLGLPFHRVYFTNGKDTVENLPGNRFKLPIGGRLNYFLGDNVIVRTYYRYYTDNWGITAHTASLEIPVKITPFFSISPFYRYYTQTAAKYFAPYEAHTASETNYTSNYAYSAFSSNFFGVNMRIAPPKGIFKQWFSSLEARYGHYTQTTDLSSDVVSLDFKFK